MRTKRTFSGMENLGRAFEIALSGRHTLFIHYPKDEAFHPREKEAISRIIAPPVTSKDTVEIKETFRADRADILIEVTRSDFSSVSANDRCETVTDVIKRADDTMKWLEENDVNRRLNEPSKTLLKTAYDKLWLMPYEVDVIVNVAQTIAAMDRSTEIRTEHVAEAIQYRCVRELFPTKE
jgi:hypothetical protein